MLSVTILGSNSAIAAYGRNPTAQAVQTDETAYLVDCGEGTQGQMSKYKVRSSKISHIFISHLHGDHYFGLIGLLTSMGLLGRTTPLQVYGPAMLEQIIQLQFDAAGAKMPYELTFHTITESGEIASDHKVSVHAFKVKHRIECWGFLFKEKKKPRRLLAEKAQEVDVPFSFYKNLQEGEDFISADGQKIENGILTEPSSPAKSYAYCADTIFTNEYVDVIRGVDLLYHEATYLCNDEDKATARFHCTTEQAANIAKMAGAKKLLVGHFSSRYEVLEPYLQEVLPIFPNAELAVEGSCFIV